MRVFLNRSLTGIILIVCFGFGSASAVAPKDVPLDGVWQFIPDPPATIKIADLPSGPAVRPINVPGSWQSQFNDLRDYAGVAWYWRTATLAPTPPGQVALLHFGAVDYRAEVFVNGQKAGAHEGGYLPFEFDVTNFIRAGENQIAVRVADPGAKPNEVVEGIAYAEIPHGKQNWYVQTSGLWQSVELDYRPQFHGGNVHITAGADGRFKIHIPWVNPSDAGGIGFKLDATILDPASKQVWQGSHALTPAEHSTDFSGQLNGPALWSTSNPALYTLEIKTSLGEAQSVRFGFRTFETREGKFYLNGALVYVRGALDQDFYPDTVYTPPSLDYLRDEMRKAKALGLNLLRCHIKVPDPRYLEAADEIGMLVWYEIPNWDKLTPASEHRGMETLHGMVDRDSNHPSIVIVSIINESWGADLKEVADRTWLKSAYQEAKTFVPWLVVDNSACCDNFHMATDIADYHEYAAIPDYASNFDRLLDDQAQRPGWLFSPYGDATPKGDEPLMLSEFGNWGLPAIPADKPWWFSRGFESKQITEPDGIEKRFADYQYNLLFPDLKALTDATEWHEFDALRYEIGALRMHPEIQGYVITEFTDVNWEANGLLDMWRRPKAFGETLAKLQQDDLLVLRDDKWNYKAGEPVTAEVYLSHYGRGNLADAQVDWQVEGTDLTGSLPVTSMNTVGAEKVGTIQFNAPTAAKPIKRVLKAHLDVTGKPLSDNSLDYYFFPNKSPDLPPPVSFYDPPPGRLRRLVNDMHGRGYLAPSGSEAFPVLIASTLDDTVKKKLREGARVILIASDPLTLAPGIDIVPRTSGDLSGNWISD